MMTVQKLLLVCVFAHGCASSVEGARPTAAASVSKPGVEPVERTEPPPMTQPPIRFVNRKPFPVDADFPVEPRVRPAWFRGPFEGGLAHWEHEVGGCRETFKLVPNPAAETFLRNLAGDQISVYRPGSTFVGYTLAVYPTATTVCLSPFDRAAARESAWPQAGNPAEMLAWALAVFSQHGVEPAPPYPADELRATWTGKTEWWRRREPPTDFVAMRDALLAEGVRLPPRYLAEADAWALQHGKNSK